jgi:hypothetical protein
MDVVDFGSVSMSSNDMPNAPRFNSTLAPSPVNLCINSFFDRCLTDDQPEESAVPCGGWGDDSGVLIHDVQTLARASDEEEPTPQAEHIGVVVMPTIDNTHRSWLQRLCDHGDLLASAIHMSSVSTEAVQMLSLDALSTQLGMPVGEILLLTPEQLASAIEAHNNATNYPANALKIVHQCSRRQKLKKDQADSCPICLEKFSKSQQVRTLPCFHQLHGRCCAKYFKTPGVKPMCPVCRFDMCELYDEEEVTQA